LCGVVFALRRGHAATSFRTIAAFLGLGLIAVLLGEIWSLLAERWLLGRINVALYYSFVTASMPEEGFRFLAILYGLRKRPDASFVAAMLLGSLVGLVFATYEHVGYAVLNGWRLWLARSFTSVPYHTLSGAVLGYAAVVWSRSRHPKALIGLAVLIVVHGLADWPMVDPSSQEIETPIQSFVSSGWAGNIASLLVVLVLAIIFGRKARRSELHDGATPTISQS
jgi:RsiW-degrading membrane proteinase PrsW (M82 family)